MRYGTRIYRRKGYWLTALTAIVLLAASPGTASAQVEVTGPDEVTEGGTATYSVSVKGYVNPGASVDEVVVTLATPTAGDTPATAGEPADLSTNVDLEFRVDTPAGPEAGDDVVGRAFSATGTIRLQTLDDLDAEDEDFNLTFTVTEAGGLVDAAADGDAIVVEADAPDALTIEDDETQSYDLTTDDDDAKEGQAETVIVTVTANPAHEDGSAMLSVQLDAARTVASITIPATAALGVIDDTNRTRDVTITLGENDENRDEDTITVSVYSGSAGNSTLVDSLSIDIEDRNALPAVAMMVVDEDGDALDPQPTSVKEGETTMVAVMVVDKDGEVDEAAEDLTVQLMPTGTADSADYILTGSSDIEMGDEMSAVIDIEVRSDEDVGRESLMFDAVVTGDSANGPGTRTSARALSLYLEDETAKKITPKATDADYDAIKAAIAAGGGDDGLNPGDTVTLMTNDLFDLMDGYTASYGVSVEGDSASASASGESVTINALMAGEAKITVTGTARMSSSSLMPSQTVSNVAELTFPVTVVDTTLVVTLSADPMEIEEGSTSEITATASRAVTAGDGDVEIALTVVGDGELDAESITIAAGEESGSAMLTATEDDEDFENETVTVVATGSGIDGTMQVAIAVTDNDTAPAAPNQISAKSQDEAYPVITGAIAEGAGEDEMLTPGESFSIMTSDLFTVMEGYTASYRVSVDGTAVTGSASDDSISVTADAAGEAKVTITGTAKMAASSFEASQDATNVASITFPVTVVAAAEPVPALPLIAQWLLGLGLLGGGARQLYRRRRQG